MIEINLLPQEMRQPEGTPLPRLLTIIGGVVLAVVGGLFGAQYYVVKIPQLRIQISDHERVKAQKGNVRERVAALQRDLSKIQEKVNSMQTLEDSRIRWARVLDRIRKAVPEDCVLRRFTYRPEGAPVAAGVPTGKRYTISLQGATAGETTQQCTEKLLKFKSQLMQYLDVPTTPETPVPVAAPAPPPEVPPGLFPHDWRPYRTGSALASALAHTEPVDTVREPRVNQAFLHASE
jgi:Tfp pilus assembly protein PilN